MGQLAGYDRQGSETGWAISAVELPSMVPIRVIVEDEEVGIPIVVVIESEPGVEMVYSVGNKVAVTIVGHQQVIRRLIGEGISEGDNVQIAVIVLVFNPTFAGGLAQRHVRHGFKRLVERPVATVQQEVSE